MAGPGAIVRLRRLAVAAALALASTGAFAQTTDAFPLREDVRQKLNSIQESWIEWLTAAQGGEGERASAEVEALVSTASGIGLPRLPELSIAAAARAERFARERDFTGAELALTAAERLAPGRPETAYARASVDRLRGERGSSILWTLRGYWRSLWDPLYRYVLLGDLLLWSLAVGTLMVAGLVAMQWTTRGVLLFRDLVRFFSRSVPMAVAYALALALLLWPVLLPAGLLWLALYWSVLAWGYFGRWEKLAIVLAWIAVGLAPLLVSEQIRRMYLDTTPPVRAMSDVVQGRLVGSLFRDLAPLAEQMPESASVRHFMADLHLSIHQWEYARILYRQVLTAEPDNATAAADLGTSYFYEGDLEQAERYLRQATGLESDLAEAHFNLSRALSEQYRFDESETALRKASSLNAEGVGEWIRAVDRSEVVLTGGGFSRRDEIRSDLARIWREQDSDSDLFALWRRTMSLPLALVFVFPALLLLFIANKGGNRSRRVEANWFAEPFETVRRVMLPGFFEAEQGRWRSALMALLIPLVLLAIPLWSRFTYGVPWVLSPPGFGLGYLPLIGLLAFLLLRCVVVLRRGRVRGG